MEYIEYLLENACERCENGKFEGCDSYLNCPVYALYCEANKKEKIVYKQDSWQTPPTPKSEMI
jgi:hypothetical protein